MSRFPSSRRFSLALAAAAVGATAVVQVPASAAPATPAVPAGLPAAIEAASGYLPQVACDPVTRPGAKALGDLLRTTYPGTSYGLGRSCVDGTTEHSDGRAVDWMIDSAVPAQKAKAEAFLSWLLATDAKGNKYAMARRLGVMYLIWDKKIFGLYRPQDGWRPYACSGTTLCHQDHVHISLTWAGAMGRTSYWTQKAAAVDYGPCRPSDLNWAPPYQAARTAACPGYPVVKAPVGASALVAKLYRYSGAQVGPGSSGVVVTAVQQALGVGADGKFGAATKLAVVNYQKGRGLPQTGTMTADTWRALLAPAVKAPVAAPATAPAPVPATTTAPVKTPAPVKVPAPARKAGPLTRYKDTTLRLGSRGDAVKALQKALGIKADGRFGENTRTAVKKFQKNHKLTAHGVVGGRTWKALGA
ncbi:peptidoglycan-binding domain-containing protein [Spirillospora albida]|uniref:peptidoglycan-binding domain-containing protein n=1 Tax=Spirillospora albida TaxID=58123 RepID=UPI0004C14957|nr:peptidoglycan-binding protein [Spirillospora albida]